MESDSPLRWSSSSTAKPALNRRTMLAATLKLSLVCFGVAVSAVITEFYLTNFAPHSATFPRGFYEPDKYIGWKGIPGKDIAYRKGQIVARVKINSHGFRDREHAYEKKEDVFRIVFLGDSFTAANQVFFHQTFPSILETRLNSGSDKRYEVINLGVDGFGTAQEYLTLKHYGLKYQPDIVALAFYTGNDLINNSLVLQSRADGISPRESTGRPFFTLNHGKLAELPFKIGSGHASEQMKQFKSATGAGLQRFKGFLEKAFPNTYYSLSDAVHEIPWLTKLLWHEGIISTNLSTNSSPRADNFTSCYVYAEEYSPEWQEAWKLTKALMARISMELREINVRFFVVVIPEEEEFRPDIWGKEGCSAIKTMRLDLRRPERLLSEFLTAEGIHHLQLRPEFEKYYVATGKRLHLPYNYENHWNAYGHALAAELIYKKIKQDGLIAR